MTGLVSENENDYFDFAPLFDIIVSTEPNEIHCHDLTEESIVILSSLENLKSKRIYKRYQKKYMHYV